MSKPTSVNRKKSFFIFPLFIFLICTQYAKAQAPEYVRRNVIKTNPLAMLQGPIMGFGEYRLIYERAITPSHAVQVTAGYLGKGVFNMLDLTDFTFANPYAEEKYNGYRAALAYKFYFDAYAPTGWYLMPMGSYAYGKINSTYDPPSDYITATFINATINLGYQVLIGDRFSFDIYSGLGWKNNEWKGFGQYHQDPTLPEQATPAKFNLGMNMGVAF